MEFLLIGGIGAPELILIVLVLLILFGGKKLPELMRGAGRGIREFKDAVNTATAPEDDKKPAEKKEEKMTFRAAKNRFAKTITRRVMEKPLTTFLPTA